MNDYHYHGHDHHYDHRCHRHPQANPSLDRPVNPTAADLYVHSTHFYEQLVMDCVVASRRVEGTDSQGGTRNSFRDSTLIDSSLQSFLFVRLYSWTARTDKSGAY